MNKGIFKWITFVLISIIFFYSLKLDHVKNSDRENIEDSKVIFTQNYKRYYNDNSNLNDFSNYVERKRVEDKDIKKIHEFIESLNYNQNGCFKDKRYNCQ